MSTVKCYKIMNGRGLFSTGGSSPKWTTKGKVWTSKQAVMAHLALFVPTKHYGSSKSPYCATDQIVEMIISTEESSRMLVMEELARLSENRKLKDTKQEEKWAKDRLERAKKDLEKAQNNLNKLTNK